LGGILRYVIEESRLPRDVLDHDITGILDTGVEAKTNAVLGRDFTVDSLLKEGYDAVLLTTGGFDSRKILQPDQKRHDVAVPGVFTVIEFLLIAARGEKIETGKHVAIFYAGLKSLEIARKCREMGAEKVTIVSNRPPDSLPADLQDIDHLHNEGIDICPSTNITAIGGISEKLNRVLLEGPVVDLRTSGEQEMIEVDTLILSGGRAPEMVFVHAVDKPVSPEEDVKWQTIETFRSFPGNGFKGILSSPEPERASDSTAVVKAILSGRRLARGVHQYFTEGAFTPISNLAVEADYILDVTEVHGVSPSQRQRPPQPTAEGKAATDLILPAGSRGLDEATAVREAERCLQCGLICYKKG